MTAKLLFSAEDIAARVAEMGEEISAAYAGEPLVAVCVLKGAVHFFSDLTRAISREDMELDFVRLASYGLGTVSSREVKLTKDLECDVRGKHVLVVEDVVDSGHSLRFLLDVLTGRGARSVRFSSARRSVTGMGPGVSASRESARSNEPSTTRIALSFSASPAASK